MASSSRTAISRATVRSCSPSWEAGKAVASCRSRGNGAAHLVRGGDRPLLHLRETALVDRAVVAADDALERPALLQEDAAVAEPLEGHRPLRPHHVGHRLAGRLEQGVAEQRGVGGELLSRRPPGGSGRRCGRPIPWRSGSCLSASATGPAGRCGRTAGAAAPPSRPGTPDWVTGRISGPTLVTNAARALSNRSLHLGHGRVQPVVRAVGGQRLYRQQIRLRHGEVLAGRRVHAVLGIARAAPAC